MNKADTTLLINKELTRIGIPLEHEHASYFRDGYLFAQKQELTLTVVGVRSEQFFCCKEQIEQRCNEQCLGCYTYKRD